MTRLEAIGAVLVLAVVLVVVVGHFTAPCEVFHHAPTKDVPARCLQHFSTAR